MLISVIIPVYNAEKYLPQAMDSMLAQTFTDYECVCVNDGSTDGSAAVLTRYEQKFREAGRTLRIITKENGGEGSARNVGMDAARGEYITWLDADDVLAPQRFEVAARMIEAEHPDLVRLYYTMGTDAQFESWKAKVDETGPDWSYETLTDAKQIFHWGWGELNGNGMVWLWFAKCKLLEGMRFRPEMRVKTDCVFSSSLIPGIKKLCVSNDGGHFYRLLPTSMFHTTRKAQDCINCQHAFLDLWNEQKDYADKLGEIEFLKYRIRRISQGDLIDWIQMRPSDEPPGARSDVRDAYLKLINARAFSRKWAIEARYILAMPLYDCFGWTFPVRFVDRIVELLRRVRSYVYG